MPGAVAVFVRSPPGSAAAAVPPAATVPGNGVTEAGGPAVTCPPGPAAELLSGTELTQADRRPGGVPGALGQLSDHEPDDRHDIGIVDQIDLPTAFTA